MAVKHLHNFALLMKLTTLAVVFALVLIDSADSRKRKREENYEIGFERKPKYLEKDMVVLTFTDGPDHQQTPKVLNILRDKNVKACFFLNMENRGSIPADAIMQNLVIRMMYEGHEIGNHGFHHVKLADLYEEDKIEEQITKSERTMKKVLGKNYQKMTLMRAPYGHPYLENNDDYPSAEYRKVAPIVARHAVHIGWSINPKDDECDSGECVFNKVKRALKTPGKGSYGILTLHCTNQYTVEALPRILKYIKSSGFRFGSVEDVVRARYGKSSKELVFGGGKSSKNSKHSKNSFDDEKPKKISKPAKSAKNTKVSKTSKNSKSSKKSKNRI